MTLQTKTANASSITTLFADNTTAGISEEDERTIATNLLDGIWGRVSASIDDGDSPYTVDTDLVQIVLADPTSGAITVNLPALSGLTNPIIVVNIGTSNAVTVDGDGSEPILGSTTYSLPSQWDSAIFFPATSLWVVLATK